MEYYILSRQTLSLGFFDQMHDMKNPAQCPRTDLYFPYVKFLISIAQVYLANYLFHCIIHSMLQLIITMKYIWAPRKQC